MSDEEQKEMFSKILDAVNKLEKQIIIPVDVDLWDVKTIASYMKRNAQVVRERITSLPDFPAAIRLPSNGPRGGYPLWKATEVMAWVQRYKDTNQEKRLSSSSR